MKRPGEFHGIQCSLPSLISHLIHPTESFASPICSHLHLLFLSIVNSPLTTNSMTVNQRPLVTAHYEYHHGSGKHILRKEYDDEVPVCSIRCCLNHILDLLIFCLAIGFLVFAGWLCYYLYTNYQVDN